VTRLVILLQEVKLWGARFEKPVTEAVTKFSESVSYGKRLYSQDLKGSKPHCKMLAAQVNGTVM
jgi:argininosuccinate lyase